MLTSPNVAEVTEGSGVYDPDFADIGAGQHATQGALRRPFASKIRGWGLRMGKDAGSD